MHSTFLWTRFQKYFLRYNDLGFSIDISRMGFPDNFFDEMSGAVSKALDDMEKLEKGAIANPDENRMVGHYWLRDAAIAPTKELRKEIIDIKETILKFSSEIHSGVLRGSTGKRFTDVLSIGIGGSALGPQLVSDALRSPQDALTLHFLDNTDPDGFAQTLEAVSDRLDSTLVIVISKSGGTKEPRNGMLVTQAAFKRAGVPFAKHFVAVTEAGSQLDQIAKTEEWLRCFPMYDWVGGRTSVMSAVGLLPMSLQGIDVESFLQGACAMDLKTRNREVAKNASLLLALMWYYAGDGKGKKDMILLPYKDRLLLFSRYLQQLVMESLGKELDLEGKVVHQGIAVYGNKGSTDQHAYVQQLRDGVNNFFVTFIEVRRAALRPEIEVEPGITSGDYLQGFLRGTRNALHEKGRDSITISISQFDAFALGALIALYERAVGFYGSLVHINAYHQPGVEAGKKAAARILKLQEKAFTFLKSQVGSQFNAEKLAQHIDAEPEETFHILQHLAINRGNAIRHDVKSNISEDTFYWKT
ncbi:MAG: glucose-6-phosphate isomerase [Verrucomicrobia bacterium]|nr:MAG: glucose-6-phosphate isomerase [Verrucomicrobiota bacterium]